MITLFGILITIVGVYTISKLMYQGEQEQSQLSKGVTILAVFGNILLLVISWLLVFQIGDNLNRVLGK